jgi:2-oxoacid:acceptor oxidoreductase delta subunit (pyruvate/2-ketoisovalerate family)
MPELKPSNALPVGGTVIRDETVRPVTGGWRTGVKPRVDLTKCVNCMLCWVYCPDAAVVVEETTFRGFDYDVCKGCEICAEMCPEGAIDMVAESTPLPELGAINGGTDE